MILYLPLIGNVGNEGAGASPSPTLAGHARDLAATPAVCHDTTLKTRHQRRHLAIHASEADRVR